MTEAPASIAALATSDLNVSIEIMASGNRSMIALMGSMTLLTSSFSEISVAPGLEEYPPISKNVAPYSIIFPAV